MVTDADMPDDELPGMWESADFIGGETDKEDYRESVGEDYEESAVCPYCHDTWYAPPKHDPLKHHIDYCPQNPSSDIYGMKPGE